MPDHSDINQKLAEAKMEYYLALTKPFTNLFLTVFYLV